MGPPAGAGSPPSPRNRSDRPIQIVGVRSRSQVEEARRLLGEYAEGLEIDLDFQGFEGELARLPGEYAESGGRLLLAYREGRAIGVVGLRRWSRTIGEVKRLYVRPAERRRHAGRRLVAAIVAAARRAGYRRLRLDTLPTMDTALRLYASFGFRDIPAYRLNPVPGARYLELWLPTPRRPRQRAVGRPTAPRLKGRVALPPR